MFANGQATQKELAEAESAASAARKQAAVEDIYKIDEDYAREDVYAAVVLCTAAEIDAEKACEASYVAVRAEKNIRWRLQWNDIWNEQLKELIKISSKSSSSYPASLSSSKKGKYTLGPEWPEIYKKENVTEEEYQQHCKAEKEKSHKAFVDAIDQEKAEKEREREEEVYNLRLTGWEKFEGRF